MGGRGCSELSASHCTPAWVTKQDSISKQTNKQTNKQKNKIVGVMLTEWKDTWKPGKRWFGVCLGGCFLRRWLCEFEWTRKGRSALESAGTIHQPGTRTEQIQKARPVSPRAGAAVPSTALDIRYVTPQKCIIKMLTLFFERGFHSVTQAEV